MRVFYVSISKSDTDIKYFLTSLAILGQLRDSKYSLLLINWDSHQIRWIDNKRVKSHSINKSFKSNKQVKWFGYQQMQCMKGSNQYRCWKVTWDFLDHKSTIRSLLQVFYIVTIHQTERIKINHNKSYFNKQSALIKITWSKYILIEILSTKFRIGNLKKHKAMSMANLNSRILKIIHGSC